MDIPLFWWQVLASFFVGGILIALQSIAAEKATPGFSGVIAALPTTMVGSFFFLGMIQSQRTLAESMSSLPSTLAGALLFLTIFVILASHTKRSFWKYVLILLAGLLMWAFFPAFVWYFDAPGWYDGSVILFLTIILSQLLLAKAAGGKRIKRKKLPFHWKLLLLRSVIAGTVVAGALLAYRYFGPFWGAVVGGTFPASWATQSSLYYWSQDPKSLPQIFMVTPCATVLLVFYMCSVLVFYPMVGVYWGTLCCVVLTGIGAYGFSLLTRKLE